MERRKVDRNMKDHAATDIYMPVLIQTGTNDQVRQHARMARRQEECTVLQQLG